MIERAGITETITNTYFKSASGTLQPPALRATMPIGEANMLIAGDAMEEGPPKPTEEQQVVMQSFLASLVPNAGPARRSSLDIPTHSTISMDENSSTSTLELDDLLGPAQPRAKRARKDMAAALEDIERDRQDTKRQAKEYEKDIKMRELELAEASRLDQAALERHKIELTTQVELRRLEVEDKRYQQEMEEKRAQREIQHAMITQLQEMMKMMVEQTVAQRGPVN